MPITPPPPPQAAEKPLVAAKGLMPLRTAAETDVSSPVQLECHSDILKLTFLIPSQPKPIYPPTAAPGKTTTFSPRHKQHTPIILAPLQKE